MRKNFSANVRSSETKHGFWLPGLETYLTMIRCEPREAAVNITGALLIFAVLFFMLFISWTTIDVLARPPVRTEQRQLTPVEKAKFHKRLVYHGLHNQVSVVYDYPEKPYFIRDGQRCRF
jgi:hypothetical protein